MRDAETQGLVLYSRNYKEKDKLVKIFTESFGKRMFFVKNFGKSPYASSLQAFTDGKLTATINDGGFSFIEDVSEVVVYKNISSDLLDQGFDMEVVTNIFELQVLHRFGISLNFSECAFCHKTVGPFDFSYKFSGCLCPQHFDEDLRRSHLDPNVIYLVNLFQEISLDELKKISIKADMKLKIRQFIDGLYDEYVGIHLKSKKFLDGMSGWADIMK